MNRRGLKEASRQCIRDAQSSTKLVTLCFLLSVYIVIAADWGLGTLVQSFSSKGHYLSQAISAETKSYILVFLISFVCQFVLVFLAAGYASFSLKLSRGKPFSKRVLTEGFQIWGKCVLLYLMISLLLSLWSSIFSMPISYLLSALFLAGSIGEDAMFWGLLGYMALVMLIVSYRYRTAWFVLMDHPELSVRQVLNQAKAINRIHRWKLFLLDLSFLPWLLLGVLTLGILFIWKLPYITATYAHAYNFMLEDYAKRQQHLQELLEAQRSRMEQHRF